MNIYLDANATLPLLPEARTAMIAALDFVGNPASIHAQGRRVRQGIDDARKEIKSLLGATEARLIFTSGATEANNLALKGLAYPHLLHTSIEHSAIQKVSVPSKDIIPVTSEGLVDVKALERLLEKSPKGTLLSVMAVNNETGVIQPLHEIVALARRHGALVHTDAVQAIGKIPFSFGESGVDLMSISAHKFGGPAGVGALVLKESLHLKAQMEGGGQEYGLRSGTLAFHQIAGMAAALKVMLARLDERKHIEALRDHMEDTLKKAGARVVGEKALRAPGTSCLIMPEVDAALQVMAFDLEGVCISAGSACSSGKIKRSPVLEAMGVEDASSAIRVSLCPTTTAGEIATFTQAWIRQYNKKTTVDRIAL